MCPEWVWRKMEVFDTNFSCSTNVPEAAALKRDYPLAFDAAKVPATHAELLEKAERAVEEWLDHAKEVPGHLLAKAKGVIHAKYAVLSARYNPGFADAIIACGLIGLPIPVPGAVFVVAAPMVAAAEFWRHFGKKELSADIAAVKKVAAEFWAELLKLFDSTNEKLDAPSVTP